MSGVSRKTTRNPAYGSLQRSRGGAIWPPSLLPVTKKRTF